MGASIDDLTNVPFTTKDGHRGTHPVGMMATDLSEVCASISPMAMVRTAWN